MLGKLLRFLKIDSFFVGVLKNSSWLLAAQVGVSMTMMLQGVISTRALGVQNYGFFVLILSYTQFIFVLLNSRVWSAVIRYIPHFQAQNAPQKAKAMLKLCLWIEFVTIALTFFTLMVTASLAAEHLAKAPHLTPLFRFYALVPLLTFTDEIFAAILRLDNRFRAIATIRLAWAIVFLLMILGAASLGMSLALMVLIQVIVAVFNTALYAVWGQRSLWALGLGGWWRTPLMTLRGEFREALWFMFGTNMAGSVRMISRQIDILVLGWLGTPTQVGLYGLAKRIGAELLTFINHINRSLEPAIARLVSKNAYDQLHQSLQNFSRLMLLVTVPSAVILSIGVTLLIPPVFGEEFRGAIPMAQIWLWAILSLTTIWYPSLFNAMGLSFTVLYVHVAALVTLIILQLLLVPTGGGVGTAWAMLGSYLVSTFIGGMSGYIVLRRRSMMYPTVTAT